MDLKYILIIIACCSVTICSTSSCEMRDLTHCNYTVVCSVNSGSVPYPNCNEDPYVVFIITLSKLEYLTTGYFAATNFDSRVREIKAFGNSWKTITSSAFRYYTKAIVLDLSYNEIVDIKNDAFGSLIHLQSLNISNNQIENLNIKSFGISTSVDNNVQVLDLSNNKLVELSGEINELSRLNSLYLQNNLLKYIADDAFMSLKKLKELYLQNNQLQFLNLTLTNLKMLRTLDLSYNNLKYLSGFEINRLVSIEYFNASHNNLTSVESNCFNQAFHLKSVDLSYNNIKSNIETVMFINNNQLNYLNFYNNHVTNIQDNSFEHCNLQYINFENNNITGDLQEKTLAGLLNISELDLSKQNINSIKDKAFAELTSLHYLNLSMNNITTIENSSFVNTTISYLDLSYNKISNLNFLENCLTDLTVFNVSNNNITVLPKNVLSSQIELRRLDLSMNKIKQIEPNSLPLQKLEYLNITGNCLSGAIKNNMFSPARYLRFLDLSNFNISEIDALAFVDLTVLARLNLSNNQISSINPNNFGGVVNMYSLDLSHNKLKDLTLNNTIMSSLRALYLNDNDLRNISWTFSNKSQLLYLDLSNNNIDNLLEIGNKLFPNLTVLRLDNNKIKQFNNPKINSLVTLIDLTLSSNEISYVDLSYYKELMSVDLSNNNLTYLNSSLIKNNINLQSLDVSRNFIRELPPGTFQFMKNLKLLNFSSNSLTKLRYGSLKGLHKTEVLDISRNNIIALDVDVFHECDELKTLIVDYNQIKTFDVERLVLVSLKKLTTLSLGGNPISCKEIVRNIKASNITFLSTRQVQVTSIDKIYHEDNVHGIKCGDDKIIDVNGTAITDAIDSKPDDVSSTTVIVLIWCSIITIIFISGGAILYIKLYRKRYVVENSNLTMRMRNSLNIEGTEFQSDLLG